VPVRFATVKTAATSVAEALAADADLVVHGDSRGVVDALPDGSVDAIYVDPPFGTGTVRRGRGAGAAYTDVGGDPAAFVAWLAPWLAGSHRVLRASGSLFVHLDWRTVHYVKVALDGIFGADRLVNEIVWCYSVGGKSRRGFGRKHDTILWYARGEEYAFYPDAIRVARRAGSHMRVVAGPDGAPVQEKTDRKTGRVYRYPVSAGKIPEDWWADIETLNHSDKERTGWPSQKPERLVERVLAATTREGDRVADWFAGSGTTAAVARRLGRRFVVGDAEAGAIEAIRARLAAGVTPRATTSRATARSRRARP
jgi:DNA modification methylase